jgi:hypothetical protein
MWYNLYQKYIHYERRYIMDNQNPALDPLVREEMKEDEKLENRVYFDPSYKSGAKPVFTIRVLTPMIDWHPKRGFCDPKAKYRFVDNENGDRDRCDLMVEVLADSRKEYNQKRKTLVWKSPRDPRRQMRKKYEAMGRMEDYDKQVEMIWRLTYKRRGKTYEMEHLRDEPIITATNHENNRNTDSNASANHKSGSKGRGTTGFVSSHKQVSTKTNGDNAKPTEGNKAAKKSEPIKLEISPKARFLREMDKINRGEKSDYSMDELGEMFNALSKSNDEAGNIALMKEVEPGISNDEALDILKGENN